MCRESSPLREKMRCSESSFRGISNESGWKRHERALKNHGHRRVAMDYADFFSDPEVGGNPCHALTAREREVARELFLQRRAFDQRWS